MANCAECGSALLPGAVFCGSCGSPVAIAAPPPAAPPRAPSVAGSGGLPSNVAGALAYFTIIPPIIFLVVEPFNKDRFIKFHSIQSLILAATFFVVSMVLFILSIILNLIVYTAARWIPFLYSVTWIVPILMWLVWIAALFVTFVTVIFLMYKAYNEVKCKLPLLGGLAERLASK